MPGGRSTSAQGFDVGDVDPDPIVQVRRWLDEWAAVAPNEPDAVVLATADGDGRPSVRTVLLRGFDERGCTVFTSYDSRKGQRPRRQPPRRDRVQLGAAAAAGEPARPDDAGPPAGERGVLRRAAPRKPAGGLGVAPVERARRPARAGGPLRRRPATGSGTARCRARRPGAATGWSPIEIELWQGRPSRMHDRLRYERDAATRHRVADRSPQPVDAAQAGPAGRGRGQGADERHLVRDRARPAGRSAHSGTVRDRVRGGSSSWTPPWRGRLTGLRPVHAAEVGGDAVQLVDDLVAGHARRGGGRRGASRGPGAGRRAAARSTGRPARSRGPRPRRRRGRGRRPARGSRRAPPRWTGMCQRNAGG